MRTEFIPEREVALDGWAANLVRVLERSPQAFGLTQQAVATLGERQAVFAGRMADAANPAQCTRLVLAAKRDAKTALVSTIRECVRVVQAAPGVSATDRMALGITVRDGGRGTVAVPEVAPQVYLMAVEGALSR